MSGSDVSQAVLLRCLDRERAPNRPEIAAVN